jgi:hypothetical protein
MGSRTRTLGRWLSIAAVALLLAGCVRVDMELEVSHQNTVSGSAILAVDDSLLELSGQSADELFQGMDTTTDLPDGATVEPYEDDGFVGQRITFEEVALAEFSQGGGMAPSGEELSITREGDEFLVNGRLDMTSSEFGGGGEVPQQFLENIEFRIAITFPGSVSSSTGDVDGNTVTWTPQVGERTEIRAVASAIPSTSSLLPIVLAVVGALVLAFVLFLVVSRRRTPASATVSGWAEPTTTPLSASTPIDAPAGFAPPPTPTDAPDDPPSSAPDDDASPPPVPPVPG